MHLYTFRARFAVARLLRFFSSSMSRGTIFLYEGVRYKEWRALTRFAVLQYSFSGISCLVLNRSWSVWREWIEILLPYFMKNL